MMTVTKMEALLKAILDEEMKEVSSRVIYRLTKEIWRKNLSPKEEQNERLNDMVERHS